MTLWPSCKIFSDSLALPSSFIDCFFLGCIAESGSAYRVTTSLEKLEMSGNLTAVGKKSGNCPKVRELSVKQVRKVLWTRKGLHATVVTANSWQLYEC